MKIHENLTTTNFSHFDDGKHGKALEMLFTEKERVQAQGKTDYRINRKGYEIKTGAGVLSYDCKSFFKGSPKVIYIPVVVEGEPLKVQEGYILRREVFLQVLENVGLIRYKVSTQGTQEITIQTFWNRKKNAPHGKKIFALREALQSNCEMTLQEFIGERA